MIDNPWTEITDTNRILTIDRKEVEIYNSRRIDNPICIDDFPEPFLGSKKAAIYLLLGNPGFDPDSEIHNYSEEQKVSVIRNLTHRNDNDEFPHYLLGNQFEDHPGYAWWHAVFQPLLKELATDKATIAKTFFCIELIGYHSQTGDEKIIKSLPSVNYSKELILSAIKKGKMIIIGRGITKWLNLISELADYDKCTFLASNRGVTLSRSTISPIAYKEVKKAVEAQTHGV
jgi:hypothetical protein